MRRRNEIKHCLGMALYTTMQTMVSGAIMQSYMLKSGVTSARVSMFVSLLQVAQVLILLLGSNAVDRIKNVIRCKGILELLCVPFFGVMMFLGFGQQIPVDIKYAVMMIMGFFTNLLIGIHTVIAFKLPYHITDLSRCGTLTAITGIVTSILGLVHSGLMSFLLGHGEYFQVMSLFWGGSGLFMAFSGALTLSLKKTNDVKVEEPKGGKKVQLIHYKPFYLLAIPNLLRGFSTGIFGVVSIVGHTYGVLDGQSTGYMVVVANIATYIGSMAYAWISAHGRQNTARALLGCSIIMALFLPVMLARKSLVVFLVVYGITYVAYQIISIAVPIILMEVVDYDVMGQYSGWRTLLHMFGSVMAVSASTYMLDFLGGTVTLTIAGIMQLLSGAAYFVLAGKNWKRYMA